MRFKSKHQFFKTAEPLEFSEHDAPDWLTSASTIKGSTMDQRWFWGDCVLKLEIGSSVNTDFQTITRIA